MSETTSEMNEKHTEKDWIGIDDVQPSRPGDPLNEPSPAILKQREFFEENPEIVDKFDSMLKDDRS